MPDKFLAAGRELARASAKQGIAFGYVTDTAQGWRLFYGLYRQTGGAFRLPAGGPAEVDVDRMAEVIAFMAKLVDGRVDPRQLDYTVAITVWTDTGETLQYVSPRLPYGRHTLRIRVTGEHDAQSQAAFVSVDRAAVYTN